MMLNYLAVAVASVAGMAVGALWFSRALFGRPWADDAGVELGKYLFEHRPLRLYAIDMGHQLAVVTVMALVIGLFGI